MVSLPSWRLIFIVSIYKSISYIHQTFRSVPQNGGILACRLYGYGLCKGKPFPPKTNRLFWPSTSILGTWNCWWLLEKNHLNQCKFSMTCFKNWQLFDDGQKTDPRNSLPIDKRCKNWKTYFDHGSLRKGGQPCFSTTFRYQMVAFHRDESHGRVSGDSWMYPDPNMGLLWEIPIQAMYIVGIYGFFESPRIPSESTS